MPSVYLEQGGRLRCQAVRGYWQIYDGMPPSAGIIGRTFRTGVTTEVFDTSRASGTSFPRSRPSWPSCACRCASAARVVGVLNAESPTLLGDDARRELERCADLLARRIEQLGGPEPDGAPGAAAGPRRRAARARSRIPRTSCARPSRAALDVCRLRVRDARARRRRTATSTPTTPRARSRACFADLDVADSGRDRAAGSATARRATPSTGDAAAGSRATSRCAAPAPRRSSCSRWPPPASGSGSSCSPIARRTAARPSTSSCWSCSPSRPPAACAWRPPCSSCATAPRATRSPASATTPPSRRAAHAAPRPAPAAARC